MAIDPGSRISDDVERFLTDLDTDELPILTDFQPIETTYETVQVDATSGFATLSIEHVVDGGDVPGVSARLRAHEVRRLIDQLVAAEQVLTRPR